MRTWTLLKSPDTTPTPSRAVAMVAARPGKLPLVCAAARFVSQRTLNEAGLPLAFASLPFAFYRIEWPQ